MASLFDYLDEFMEEFKKQLQSDNERWGDTWLKRPREGQEERMKTSMKNYFDQFENGGTPLPWLKIIGNAYICWLREQHPELWEK